MTGKKTIENKLNDLEDNTADTLDTEAMWEWVNELSSQGSDIPRPPEYFPKGAEWNDDVQELHESMAERAPELRHLSPPEAYVLSYMDEDTIGVLGEVLADSSDPEVEAWWEEAIDDE